jgi:hypothetical protein
MPEWWHTLWSYRLEDLLMFSPQAHARLFELVNRETWPAVLLAAALPALLATALFSRHRHGEPLALGGLALATAAMAELHLRQSLAGLSPIALAWAAAFGLLALGTLALALATAWGRAPSSWLIAAQEPTSGTRVTGVLAARALAARTLTARVLTVVLLGATLAWPLAAPALGRPWWQAEVFALAPDPTVLGWLAWAAITPRRGWVWLTLSAVPLAWCGFVGAMGAAMAAPLAAVLPLAGAAVVAVRLVPAHRSANAGAGWR